MDEYIEYIEDKRKKFKLRKPNKKWTDAEAVKILEFITETGYKFEKPSTEFYYCTMRDETGIDASWSLLKHKVNNMKQSFLNLQQWRDDLKNSGSSEQEADVNDSSSSNAKLVIKCQEDGEAPHPHCPHGPTLLFCHVKAGVAEEKDLEGSYYACAAHRDKRNCNFHVPHADLTPQQLRRRYETPFEEYRAKRSKFLSGDSESAGRHYCHYCNEPLLTADLKAHADHEIVRQLTPQQLGDPTQFLRPLDNDKAQAQYFFDERALRFFTQCFRDLGVNKVICMGAPRLHAFIRTQFAGEVQSFLLDFDHRFFYFFDDAEFAWYNMCNNYFFDVEQEISFCSFLKCGDKDRLLIFTDPPFGCRTEPIAHTLRQLTYQHNAINNLPRNQPLPIFWIFPYFAENYIRQQFPSLEMCDYRVNYTNHTAYTDIGSGGRRLGSPVRLFCNVPAELLRLPVGEEYKYCSACRRYTALTNQHCKRCGCCPAKNGAIYRHCERCGVCVKPSYEHCTACRRCTQREGHECRTYRAKQRCWICRNMGHTENDCQEWSKRSVVGAKRARHLKKIMCLLCGCLGHNEQRCQQRSRFIEESTFLGETQLRFKV